MRVGPLRGTIRRWLVAVSIVGVSVSALTLAAGTAAFGAIVDAITLTNGDPVAVVEGSAISNQIVARFTDTGNAATASADFCAAANTSQRYTASISWGDGLTSSGGIVCVISETPTGVFNVTGSHTYADSGNFKISVTVTDNKDNPKVTKTGETDSAAISDADLEVDFDNAPEGGAFTATEGATLTVIVGFLDNNNAFPNEGAAFDPGITATVNWGDGSAVQSVKPQAPPSACDCPGDFIVTASHLYDATTAATAHYTIMVKATDDGGKDATDTLTAKVSDAKLTAGAAKSFTSTATQASTHVVASFTDAAGAQAAAADFTASIKWGDNTTSTGTVTQTAAGAFDVRGTHTFATSGTKSLTITVTDEEGQTATMTANATVAAAPVVLPATGQPHGSGTSGWPLLPAALILLGLVGVSAGLIRTRFARR